VVRAKYRCGCDQVRKILPFIVLHRSCLVRTLVHNFPEATLGISIAVDGQIFQTDVYSASHPPGGSPRPRKLSTWGDRAVVVLIGIRLGLDGVNPIYYDTIKVGGFFAIHVGLAHFHIGAVHLSTIDRHSGRSAIVLILLCWLPGGQSILSGPSSLALNSYITATPACRRARAWDSHSTKDPRTDLGLTSGPPSLPDVSCVKPHRLVISCPSLAIPLIKTAIDKQLLLWRWACTMAVHRRQWCRIRSVRRCKRCRLGFYSGTLCDGLQSNRASHVPLRAGAQDAPFRPRSEYAHRFPMQE
jgi:hypothetical protein